MACSEGEIIETESPRMRRRDKVVGSKYGNVKEKDKNRERVK